MNTEQRRNTENEKPQAKRRGGNAVEFAAVIAVLIFVVYTAAALLVGPSHTLDAVASPPAAGTFATDNALPERPFHERYPINPAGDAVDPPTF